MINWMKIWRKTYRTMAQTLVGVLPASGLFWSWDWRPIVSTVLIAGFVCFLSGVADFDNADYSEDLDLYPDEPEDDEIVDH